MLKRKQAVNIKTLISLKEVKASVVFTNQLYEENKLLNKGA